MKKFILSLSLLTLVTTSACAAIWSHEDFLAPIQQYISKARAEVLAPLEDIENFSGLTFNPDTKSYYAIINRGDRLYEFDEDFKLKREISIGGFDDPEDLAFIKNTDKGPMLAISDETGMVYVGVLEGNQLRSRNMIQITLLDEAGRELSFGNKGLEGIVYLPQEEKLMVIKEKNPIKIWSFQMPAASGYVKVKNSFPAETESMIRDLADDLSAVSFNAKEKSIVLLSDESSKLIYVDYESKQVNKVVELKTRLQHEALTFSADYETTYVGAEPYYLLRINKTNTILDQSF